MQAAFSPLVILILLIAACSPVAPETPVATEVLAPVPATATFTPIPPTPTLPPLVAPVDLERTAQPEGNSITLFALDDLVKRLEIPREAAQLASTEETTWVNDDFECENRTASGSPINGYRLLYVVGDTVYEYHTDRVSTVRLCSEKSLYDDYPELVMQLDPTAAEMVALAKAQIVRDFEIPERRITLEEVHPQTWEDTSLGCPVEGQSYAQMEIGGYEIVLTAGSEDYIFHTDYARVTLCDSPETGNS